jgi:hypothetical protein
MLAFARRYDSCSLPETVVIAYQLTALLTQRTALDRSGREFESISGFASSGMVPFGTRTESMATKAANCPNPHVCDVLWLVAAGRFGEGRSFTAPLALWAVSGSPDHALLRTGFSVRCESHGDRTTRRCEPEDKDSLDASSCSAVKASTARKHRVPGRTRGSRCVLYGSSLIRPRTGLEPPQSHPDRPIDPLAYLGDIICRLPSHPVDRVSELTPRAWRDSLNGVAHSAGE